MDEIIEEYGKVIIEIVVTGIVIGAMVGLVFEAGPLHEWISHVVLSAS